MEQTLQPESDSRGLANSDLRARLPSTSLPCACASDQREPSAGVSCRSRWLHAHGLIAKIARTRGWRVTNNSRIVMGTSLSLCGHHFPDVCSGVEH
jgi:hypothetical protein